MREKILHIAAASFVSNGFQKTTLTNIAEILGKRKTFIYYYFQNKEAIFKAMVEIEASKLWHEINLILTDEKYSVIEKFKAYIAFRVNHMHNVAAQFRLLKSELFELLALIEEARLPFHQLEINALMKLLVSGKKNKVFEFQNEQIIAKIIVNTLKRLEIPMYVSEQMEYESDEVNALIELWLNGISVK